MRDLSEELLDECEITLHTLFEAAWPTPARNLVGATDWEHRSGMLSFTVAHNIGRAKHLIGRRGERLCKLQEQHGTHVRLERLEDMSNGATTRRVIIEGGATKAVREACAEEVSQSVSSPIGTTITYPLHLHPDRMQSQAAPCALPDCLRSFYLVGRRDAC